MSQTPASPWQVLIVSALLFTGCTRRPTPEPLTPASRTATGNIFDEYLKTDFPPADGFDFPLGDADGKGGYTDKATAKIYSGWSVSVHFGDNYSYGIHPAEDWGGSGPPASDLGQPIHALATGKVAFADFCGRLFGNVVMIDHIFYENAQKKTIRSVYVHLHEILVRSGELVQRRQVVGTVGQDPDKLFAPHLHLELRWDQSLSPTFWPSSNGKDLDWIKRHYTAPSAFINAHRHTSLPDHEANLILVDQQSYKMRLYRRGQLQGEYDVSFGQSKGPKQTEGDNKTPVGMYFVIQKHRGKFDGPYGAYYGGHWIKLNYPNEFDAARARQEGWISQSQQAAIAEAWRNRKPTLETTKLGGGIGFHGWIREWSNVGPRHLSWGCVVLHLSDVSKFYDQVPEGTMVVIF
jgi:murein DD-endopeptidase MepM/ murein hydrolase activator NlpD